ncbi:tyrosine kinase receptor Cad96Ca-like [Diadema antillarum]|uniref:tyrosine kinase receptor Cad96Ca-like n=1 Tax=Diadema antillarum TaxID=105358 RepID=UPI003A89A1DE
MSHETSGHIWNGPDAVHVARGTNATLMCSHTSDSNSSTITWLDGHVDVFGSGDAKYGNFRLVQNGTRSSVISILGVQLEDEGNYTCSIPGVSPSGVASLTVEVASSLSLSNVSDLVDGAEYTVTCLSLGARPAVDIVWFLDDCPQTRGVNTSNAQSSSGQPKLWDRRSSWTFTASLDMNGKVLGCRSDGHAVTALNGRIETQIAVSANSATTTWSTSSIAALVLGVLLILLVGLLVYLTLLLRRKSETNGSIESGSRIARDEPVMTPLTHTEGALSIYEVVTVNGNAGNRAAHTVDRELTAKQEGVEVPSRNIRFHSRISPFGEVAFGQVWKGEIRGVPGKEKMRILAAIRDISGIETNSDVLKETITTLWKLPSNVHVVKCLGYCRQQTLIVNEYVPYGTLLTFLQTNSGKFRSSYRTYANVRSIVRRVKETDLLRFAWQIAKGMQFLKSQGIIHGNLRANNVLLTDDKRCKLADYGLANIMPPKKEFRRWMSPEALRGGACSLECDVWSYGVLLWELITLGAQPYPGLSDDELEERVCGGYRMRRPRHCSQELYKIMTSCWQASVKNRCQFEDLLSRMDRTLEAANDYISLNNMDDEDIYENIPE